jgi:small subunit ribosomal protein S16
MLTIRLQRAGKKNKAEYRLVLAEKTAAAQKKFTEVLGSYNPHTKALSIRNQERMNYWIDEQHVEVSPTVHNLLVTKELVKGSKQKAFTIPKKEAVAEEAAPVVESPVEETPAAEAPSEQAVAEEAAPSDVPTEVPAPETAPVEAPPEVTAEAVPIEETPATEEAQA